MPKLDFIVFPNQSGTITIKQDRSIVTIHPSKITTLYGMMLESLEEMGEPTPAQYKKRKLAEAK